MQMEKNMTIFFDIQLILHNGKILMKHFQNLVQSQETRDLNLLQMLYILIILFSICIKLTVTFFLILAS